MNALGVIVEYNPFHNGHRYHINESKRLTGRKYAVAVMSGNFVQRGEPALCDKWQRTRMALAHGIDLVLELPVYYAASGADYFARAAVKLLHACGVVDCLCFGSECGDTAPLMQAAWILADESFVFKAALKERLRQGYPYAAAREAAYASVCGETCAEDSSGCADSLMPDGLLSQPNNILGIEYCKAIISLNSGIVPYTIKRAGGGPYLSAKKIRMAILNGAVSETEPYVPETVFETLTRTAVRGEAASIDAYSDIFRYLMLSQPPEIIRGTADMSEGLENRFRRLCMEHRGLSELLSAVKTKRYAYTRLQRAALHTILDITAASLTRYEALGGPQYLRVLGFKKSAADLLGEITRIASLPVLTNLKHASGLLTEPGLLMLEKEAQTTDLYALASGCRTANREYTEPLVIL